MATNPRAVRIARKPSPDPDGAVAPAAPSAPALGARDEFGDLLLPKHGNRAGLRRARRLLLLYLAGLLVGYGAIVALLASSPYEGVRTNTILYLFLSVLAAGSACAGYLLTVGRAPWAVYVDSADLVVRERFGRVRRFPIDDSLRVRFTQTSGPSFLSPEATETVRISTKKIPAHEYVVERGWFDAMPQLADALVVS
jgi:hypothetical protein